MRLWLALVLLGLAVGGCGHKQASFPPMGGTSPEPKRNPPAPPHMIVTPENRLEGKVVKANPGGRFVVLNFPIGHLPALDQRLNVYRFGLKIGEVRVTGPQLDDNIVADVVSGDAAGGDDVRDR